MLHRFRAHSADIAFGDAVAIVGDVDGDGHADLAVGARHDSTQAVFAGSVQVYSGRDGQVLHENHGEFVGGRLGSAVAGLGDVDGDGHADVAAGAWDADTVNGNGSGMARVDSGADGSTLYTLRGDGPSERFGAALAAAGDTQGDGISDLVVGAYAAENGGIRSGSVRVFSGADGRRIADFSGEPAAELFGAAVAGGIDSNGDGLDDLVAGAPGDDDGGHAAGGLVVSLDEASRSGGSLTILVGLRAGRWVSTPLTFDGAGSATLPLDLRAPALAGTVLRAQALDTGRPALSNGLRLLLCR